MKRKHSKVDSTSPEGRRAMQDQASSPSASSRSPSPSSNPSSGSYLPAQVWGIILDYLRYADVRSTLSTCKSIGKDAPSYVSVVTIEEQEVLNNGDDFATRFPNVTTVNLSCLLRFEVDNKGYLRSVTLRHGCIPLIVPFLTCIPRLLHVFLGNFVEKSRVTICLDMCDEPENETRHFSQLIESICNAYKNGSINQTVEIDGFFFPFFDHEWFNHRCTPGECRICHEMCSSLPLSQVLKFTRVPGCDASMQLSRRRFREILRDRTSKGDLDACIPKAKETFEYLLFNKINRITFKDPKNESIYNEQGKMFLSHIGNKEVLKHVSILNWEDEIDSNFFSADTFSDMKAVMEAWSYSPKLINRRKITEVEAALRYYMSLDESQFEDFASSGADELDVNFFSEDIFDRIQFLIDRLELSPQSFSRDEIAEWSRYYAVTSSGIRVAKRTILVKSSFDRFVKMGFTGFVEEDFVIVDETMEECAALTHLLERYREI